MFSVILDFAAVLLSSLTLIYVAMKDASDEDKEQIKKFANDVNEFYGNFLGWFNRIMNFSSSVMADGKAGVLRRTKNHEYLRLLERIRRDDRYYSKVHGFVDADWDELLRGVTSFNVEKVSLELRDLKEKFLQFENSVFSLKTNLAKLLDYWSEMDSKNRESSLDDLEAEMVLFENYKDLIADRLDQMRNF